MGIEDVIDSYYAACNDHDYDKAMDYVTGCDEEDTCKEAIEWVSSLSGEITLESVENVVITGSTATADVTVRTANSEESATIEVAALENDDGWKMIWQD